MIEDLDTLAAFSFRLADAARAETLARWREAGEARNKASDGQFDPVTEADVAAEEAMRSLIVMQYPDHGIAGEEAAERAADSEWTWSLDPIDGTRSFICGMPSWVTLIGLLRDGEPVLGLIDVPRLHERYIGYGAMATLIDPEGEEPLVVSGCSRLADARLTATDPAMFRGIESQAFARVRDAARTVRYGHDGYGYARLAAGSIDLVVESALQPYDYNALIPLIRAAGGVVGNWRGGADMSAGQIVAAASKPLFDEAVAMLESAAS